MTVWLFASTVVKAKLGGVDESVGRSDTGIILAMPPLIAEASAKPVTVEPTEFVVVTGLMVPKRSVVVDPSAFCPTEPT